MLLFSMLPLASYGVIYGYANSHMFCFDSFFAIFSFRFKRRAVIKDDDKSLIIKNVIPADEGIYICDAHNGVGQISAKAQLVVNCT